MNFLLKFKHLFQMKRIVFLLAAFVASFSSYGQTVNGKKLDELDAHYIYIFPTSKNMGGRIFVDVDYGQKIKSSLLKESETPRLVGEDGKQMEFNSMMELLNYFFKNGYEYVQGFTGSTGPWTGTQYTINCVLKRRL
jgi:aryl-phospho-beta-D-glucosidase BglC (GH1 family)